jgi:hypothetical protein
MRKFGKLFAVSAIAVAAFGMSSTAAFAAPTHNPGGKGDQGGKGGQGNQNCYGQYQNERDQHGHGQQCLPCIPEWNGHGNDRSNGCEPQAPWNNGGEHCTPATVVFDFHKGDYILIEISGPVLRTGELATYQGQNYTIATVSGPAFTVKQNGMLVQNNGASIIDGLATVQDCQSDWHI